MNLAKLLLGFLKSDIEKLDFARARHAQIVAEIQEELGQSDNLFEAKRLRHLDQKAALRCAKACALEAAYLAERPRLQHDALRYTRQQEEKKAARAAGEWGRVQWEVATSLDGECLECGSTDLQCVGHTATLFVNIAGTAELDRPVFFCNGCGLRCSAHAQSIGAFPSLLTAVPGKEVWLDEDLLMLYASLQHVSPETSELAFATSLAELAGDFLRMTGKQLHEVLGEALPEYAIHLRHVTWGWLRPWHSQRWRHIVTVAIVVVSDADTISLNETLSSSICCSSCGSLQECARKY